MRRVYIAADNIVSPLGDTTSQNMELLKNGVSGITEHQDKKLSETSFYASLFTNDKYQDDTTYTKFEKLLIASIKGAITDCGIDLSDERTVLIVSSTKGNISLLETEPNRPDLNARIALHTSANLVAEHFGFKAKPLIVSNACISGIMAILTGLRLIQNATYDNAIVVGADVITKFVLSGFQSFQAVSSEPCKPFDADRTGITLGEGAATMVLTADPKFNDRVQVLAGTISNDANHISAPSRTGEELCQTITNSLHEAGLTSGDIDFVSAHGTATTYNDEMEAKAIALAGLSEVPTNSLKGFYGHTLGAAGLIESVISIHSLNQGIILPTPGFKTLGVSSKINVNAQLMSAQLKAFVKTASGLAAATALCYSVSNTQAFFYFKLMFQFKQFSVDQSNCAMKINTDGVLLGALAGADDPATILDIGTGTGVIALMLAQRFDKARIDAVEIDESAAITAERNFNNSSFNARLNCYAQKIEDFFTAHPEKKFDLIVSNPPFYINSLQSPEQKKQLAKHADHSFFENLLKGVFGSLSEQGSCWLILPMQTAELVKSLASSVDLFINKIIYIKSFAEKAPHRELMVLSRAGTELSEHEFVIYESEGVNTLQYRNALKDFFTIF